MNMTEIQKKQLQAVVESGRQVSEIAYYTSTVMGDPESKALADGWIPYLTQRTGDFVEIIYTK